MEEDDPPPKAKEVVRIGDDLSRLSVDELEERLELLKQELYRVREEIATKQSHKSAAEAVFKS